VAKAGARKRSPTASTAIAPTRRVASLQDPGCAPSVALAAMSSSTTATETSTTTRRQTADGSASRVTPDWARQWCGPARGVGPISTTPAPVRWQNTFRPRPNTNVVPTTRRDSSCTRRRRRNGALSLRRSGTAGGNVGPTAQAQKYGMRCSEGTREAPAVV